MLFKDAEHQTFFEENVVKTNSIKDPYRQALFYTLGLVDETRKYINHLYDFKERGPRYDGLNEPWQTGTSKRVTRLAFNLYNNFHGDDEDVPGERSGLYTPEDIFACGLMVYFFEAVKLRHPEYWHEA
jgi:hypothetical protein